MKRTIIAASLLMTSGVAMANQCDVNIDGQMSLIDNVLTITTEDNDKIVIHPDYRLYINGSSADLTHEQQDWVAEYHKGITDAVPVVASIALDGVEIAAVAVEEVFNNLLGGDSVDVSELTAKLDELQDEIRYNFYADDGSIRLNSTNFNDGELLGEQWEEEFDQAVEEVVSASIGRLMVAIGTELMFGDGDTSDFEQRMETFAEDIEYKVESQAAAIEERADALCGQLAKVDYVENQLQASVSGLADLNMLSVKHGDKRM